MKKLFIVLALVAVSFAANAQESDPTLKYSVATNSWWSNWYIQANANWSAFYSSQESDLASSPLKSFRATPNFSVALGKWYTPSVGFRTKFYGIWGRQVNTENKDDNSIKSWNLQEQAVFNLSNMLCGYSKTRVWNVSWVAGAGINHYDSKNAMSFSTALVSQWRLSRRWSINLEAGWLYSEHDADGKAAINDTEKFLMAGTHDNQFYAELGLTLNLGKATWEKTPDVDAIKALSQAQIDALNAQLAEANAENARLKALLAQQKPAPAPVEKVVTVTEYAVAPVSVFFNINKSTVASKKDLVNVESLATYAKENNCNLVVTGYADSATGSEATNQALSEKRANVVANELVNMGVSRDNIEVVAAGGVSDLSPVSYNRRATVEVAK